MKILQVVPRYAPAWAYGGPIRLTYDLGKELVKRGHSVTAYSSDSIDAVQRAKLAEENLNGIMVHRFRNPLNYLSARFSFLFFFPLGLRKALMANARKYDIIHVVEARGPHNRWVTEVLFQQGKPFVWSAYGGLAGGSGGRKIYRWMYDKIFNTPKMVQAASGLIAQTTHETNVYRRFGAQSERIRLIPLAVNWHDFEILPERGQFRQNLGIHKKEKMILFVGRIHRTKGLQLLIPAFANVLKQIPESRLVIVGWDHGFLGQAKNIVQQYALGNRVLFPGAIYSKDRLKAYVDADVLALTPNVYEETSLAALEACACGTSCVLTEQCEIPELTEAGAGWIVKYDRDQVAQAIGWALQEEANVNIRGENARCLVRKKFTIEIITKEHELFFAEVCNGRTGG